MMPVARGPCMWVVVWLIAAKLHSQPFIYRVSSVSQALRENMKACQKMFFYFPTGRFILVSVSIRNTCACRFCFLRNTEKISFLESCLSFEKGLHLCLVKINGRANSRHTTFDRQTETRDTPHRHTDFVLRRGVRPRTPARRVKYALAPGGGARV